MSAATLPTAAGATAHSNMHLRATTAGTLIALDIVYGHIGASPLYTVRGVFAHRPIAEEVVLCTISAVLSTLTLLTTVK